MSGTSKLWNKVGSWSHYWVIIFGGFSKKMPGKWRVIRCIFHWCPRCSDIHGTTLHLSSDWQLLSMHLDISIAMDGSQNGCTVELCLSRHPHPVRECADSETPAGLLNESWSPMATAISCWFTPEWDTYANCKYQFKCLTCMWKMAYGTR